jgi:hypothetical protein
MIVFVCLTMAQRVNAQVSPFLRPIGDAETPTRYTAAANRPANAREMRTAGIEYLKIAPWAMPRMAYKTGMIATRPLDKDFMGLETVEEKYRYFLANDLHAVMRVENREKRQRLIYHLSPAEKYDLLVGDLDANFTHAIWDEVRRQFSKGEVPSWFGLCDGSSSASILFGEPVKSVRIKSRLPGIEVDFSIGDIKSLLSYMMTTYVSRDLPIFGKRCYIEKPDPARGECFGLNPASLHQILMQMSVDPERFPYMIVDRSSNAAVWNSALLSASFSYYHPESGRAVSYDAIDHIVEAGMYAPPAGSPGWARGTRFLLFVGTTLRMADTRTQVGYLVTGKMKEIDYSFRYALELSDRLEVIGGEWLTLEHPSFIWALTRDYQPRSLGDIATSSIDWEEAAIPEAAMNSVISSSRAAQPLFRIVNSIYLRSRH